MREFLIGMESEMERELKVIRAVVLDEEYAAIPLAEFRVKLDAELATVPPEYLPSVKIEVEPHLSGGASLVLSYSRPKTDKEQAAEAQWDVERQAVQAANYRAECERMKKVFTRR